MVEESARVCMVEESACVCVVEEHASVCVVEESECVRVVEDYSYVCADASVCTIQGSLRLFVMELCIQYTGEEVSTKFMKPN